MKSKYVLLTATILVIVLALTAFGQTKHNVKKKAVIKKNDISHVLGKPVYESTVDSLITKVWIITRKQYRKTTKTRIGKAMNKMKDKTQKMDKETKEAIMTGTHYFILDVTNINTGKQVADSSAKVEIVSPSKKMASVIFQPMENHFGGGVTLDEKGEYLFTINLNIGGSYQTSQFKHKIK